MKWVYLSEILEKPITGEWGKEGNKVKVIRTTNFTNEGVLNLSEVVTRDISEKKIDHKKLLFGDIIIEKSGGSPNQPVGRVVFFNIKDDTYLCNNFTSILRPKKEAYPKYVFYFMFFNHLIKNTLSFQNKTTGIINLKLDRYLNKVKIPLPPLEEQKRIAAILDKADTVRQKNKQILENYDRLTQSVFLDMFGDPVTNPKGWEKREFEYFATFDTKMITDFEKYLDVPHIGIANIEKETGKLINYKLVKDEDLTSGKYIFTKEHIIYSKIRPNLNKVALPNFQGLCSADAYPLLVNTNVTNRAFFATLLKSNSFLNFILKHSTRTNIPKANKQQMKKYLGIAPPLTLQNKFASVIEKIEQEKELAGRELQKSEELFQSLLQEAFRNSE